MLTDVKSLYLQILGSVAFLYEYFFVKEFILNKINDKIDWLLKSDLTWKTYQNWDLKPDKIRPAKTPDKKKPGKKKREDIPYKNFKHTGDGALISATFCKAPVSVSILKLTISKIIFKKIKLQKNLGQQIWRGTVAFLFSVEVVAPNAGSLELSSKIRSIGNRLP